MPEGPSWNPFRRDSRQQSGMDVLKLSQFTVTLRHPSNTGCKKDNKTITRTKSALSPDDAMERMYTDIMPYCDDLIHHGEFAYYIPVKAVPKKK